MGFPNCAQAFSGCRERGLLSSRGVWAAHRSGFSRGAWPLGTWASRVAAHWAPEHGLSSWVWTYLLWGMWDLPGPGSNRCPMHGRADPWPWDHQGSPNLSNFVALMLSNYYDFVGIVLFFGQSLLHGFHFSSVAQSYLSLCDSMDCSTPGLPVHHQLPELAQTLVHQVSDAIQPSQSLLSPSPPASIFPSITVFSNESVLRIRWLKYWSFSFSTSSSNKHSGLISFRIDWFALLAVQRDLKSLLQHHSSKASSVLSFLETNSLIHTWLLEKQYLWLDWPLSAK